MASLRLGIRVNQEIFLAMSIPKFTAFIYVEMKFITKILKKLNNFRVAFLLFIEKRKFHGGAPPTYGCSGKHNGPVNQKSKIL